MLFNSYEFIFLFLPVVLAGYFLLGHRNRPLAAIGWLAAASLFFYGWWNPRYLLLLLGSIAFNYAIGRALCEVQERRRALLSLGVGSNLLLLGYYKYANFFLATAGTLTGADYAIGAIVLPLGISFFTFTQIAYLVDAYRGEVHEYRFLHYLLFVTFFPHLIAGPVLHHAEIMPQFRLSRTFRMSAENFSVGFTIFVIGLFKKVVLADGVSQYVSPVFSAADAGIPVGGVAAWCAALAYTFQLYFDFSGYSDMAIGLARLFGITFPANFNSPYKAASIIEFWRRWHMTLSRFLRDYLYIALGGNRHGPARRQLNLLITMVLGGLWHGAGWTFVAWGTLHGAFLSVNHIWRSLRQRLLPDLRPSAASRWAGRLLTFFAVVVAWVFFRAGSIDAALRIVAAMAGANGFAHTDPLYFGAAEAKWLLALWLIAWALPNAQQIMLRHRGALETYVGEIEPLHRKRLSWSPRPGWAMVTAALALAAMLDLTRIREFLYFQF
jgi:D-alanyl-lipoteichoic acid acyltransferase DltB (MBOAT superfamily)